MHPNVLELIIMNKRAEVQRHSKQYPVEWLMQQPDFAAPTHSLKAALEQQPFGIIAEFKRHSPSRGVLNASLRIDQVVPAYTEAGAVAVSILTDKPFFDGNLHDLQKARLLSKKPLLRKDFIIDEYQLYEAKAFGADVVLLIAHVLSSRELAYLHKKAQQLGLEVLCEIHDEADLDKALEAEVALIGVNNRDLKTFEVSLDHSLRLAAAIPSHVVKVSESGLRTAEEIVQLIGCGYKGFLIGETFMRSEQPGQACRQLIDAVRSRIPTAV